MKVFPYLQKLSLEETSVTQHSLIGVLNNEPFNDMFNIQYLLNQCSEIDTLTDESIIALAGSKYLRNIEILDLSKGEYSCDTVTNHLSSVFATDYLI